MKILTPSGLQPFDGVGKFEHKKYYEIQFNGEYSVEAAPDHKFVYDSKKEVFAKNVNIGDIVGGSLVTSKVVHHKNISLYSPMNVANGSVYYHDDFIPSTQTFFGTGDTLINAETLLSLRAFPPKKVLEGGDVKIYEETKKDHEYLMTVDVAKGRGQDYSTFNVIDISERPFKQVATYRNNTISPILFPDVIYKYAKVYNNAYVVVESNDQGGVVCKGLYYDLEYENVHVESAVKANAIGVEMTRKVKRLGCSGIKDLLEEKKLDICDEQTILEISTFVSKGQSYEASDGNHDDLMMNLVMLGYFVSTQMFSDMTDIDLKKMMFENQMREIEEAIVPFGFVDDGSDAIQEIEEREKMKYEPWQIWEDVY